MLQNSYPHIMRFVKDYGWIEIGYDDDSPLTSFIRALNIGGMVWEGKDTYHSLEAAFGELNTALAKFFEDQVD